MKKIIFFAIMSAFLNCECVSHRDFLIFSALEKRNSDELSVVLKSPKTSDDIIEIESLDGALLAEKVVRERYLFDKMYYFDMIIRHGDLTVVKDVMEKFNITANQRNIFGYTLLMNASKCGHLDIVKYLIESSHADQSLEVSEILPKKDYFAEVDVCHEFPIPFHCKDLLDEKKMNSPMKMSFHRATSLFYNKPKNALTVAAIAGERDIVRYLAEKLPLGRWNAKKILDVVLSFEDEIQDLYIMDILLIKLKEISHMSPLSEVYIAKEEDDESSYVDEDAEDDSSAESEHVAEENT